MDQSDLISVVMPVYNSENYISLAISSILSQTYKNFELIIVDDCSMDKSLEIVKKFKEKDPRIKFFCNKKNMGIGYSRNIGIKNICYSNLLGFDTSKFNPQLRQANFFQTNYSLPKLDDKVKLIFLGRLTPDKGWGFTLKSLPKLFQTIDKNKIAILIIGDGEMKPEICQTISHFTPHFYCFGRVAPEQIPLLLVNSDFHVTTSEKETRGLTILEAFAANIPVVAPRAGGVIENIQDGINGFLFTPQDQDDFIHKLQILIENQSLRQQMGIRGRESVIGKYSWEQAVTNLLNIWEEQIIRYQNIIVDS
jgi:glycosyltransferase involved in cell wall biosynthesis